MIYTDTDGKEYKVEIEKDKNKAYVFMDKRKEGINIDINYDYAKSYGENLISCNKDIMHLNDTLDWDFQYYISGLHKMSARDIAVISAMICEIMEQRKRIDEIKIGWKKYKVIETEPTEILVGIDETRCGEIDFQNQFIYINKELSSDNKKATLLHEILHGIDEMQGIGLSEEEVSAISNGLYTILKDNDLKIVKI